MNAEEFVASMLRPSGLNIDVTFLELRDRVQVGHRFKFQGETYQVTPWQFKTKLGNYKIAVCKAKEHENG